MTLDTPTSRNKTLRRRNSDFFIASKHFVGSPTTGGSCGVVVDSATQVR